MSEYCREMFTRRSFIAPWNPWMNVAETGWRILLRPVRIVLASSNVTVACWPFAISHIVRVHNALSSSSESGPSAPHASQLSSLATALASSFMPAPPSPYFSVTGKECNLQNLRVIFCECHMKIRSKPDLRLRLKPEPLTMRCIYLGDASPTSNPTPTTPTTTKTPTGSIGC